MPQDYIEQSDAEFLNQLIAFRAAVPVYAGALGLTAADLAGQAADTAYFQYVTAARDVVGNSARQWNGWLKTTRQGGNPPAAGAAAPPILPPAVAVVAPGIEPRFRALAQRIKVSPNYNEAIGKALGIVRTQQVGPDLLTVAPVLTAAVSGNHVLVGWDWGGNAAFLDQCQIEVDRGDGKGFVFLTIDTTPGYVDSAALPASPVKWSYRAIYRVGDGQVGKWSAPAAVLVG